MGSVSPTLGNLDLRLVRNVHRGGPETDPLQESQQDLLAVGGADTQRQHPEVHPR